MSELIVEEWRPIAGTDGWCEVSSLGRVRSWRSMGRTPARLLAPRIKKASIHKEYGYHYTSLKVNGKLKTMYIHWIVADAFLGKRLPGMDRRHKDGDKGNNRADNIIFGSRADNEADKVIHGRSNRGERCGSSKLSASDVLAIRQKTSEGASKKSLALAYNVDRTTIHDISRRRTWASLG